MFETTNQLWSFFFVGKLGKTMGESVSPVTLSQDFVDFKENRCDAPNGWPVQVEHLSMMIIVNYS